MVFRRGVVFCTEAELNRLPRQEPVDPDPDQCMVMTGPRGWPLAVFRYERRQWRKYDINCPDQSAPPVLASFDVDEEI